MNYHLGTMTAEYRFTFDGEYAETGWRRFYRQRPWWLTFQVVKWLAGLSMVILAAFLAGFGAYKGTAVPSLFVAFLVMAPRFDGWRVRKRSQQYPSFGQPMVNRLSEEGFEGVGPFGDFRVDWRALTKGVRFKDGLLLLHGPGIYSWLPNSAAVDNAAEVAEALMRANLKSFRQIG